MELVDCRKLPKSMLADYCWTLFIDYPWGVNVVEHLRKVYGDGNHPSILNMLHWAREELGYWPLQENGRLYFKSEADIIAFKMVRG